MSKDDPIPSSFSSLPGQDLHSYFHNICIEFKKLIENSQDINELKSEMNKLLNASKQMKWKKEKGDIWRKKEGEKAISKVFSEFSRYIDNLQNSPERANPQDLLDSLAEIERLEKSHRVI